MNRIIDHELSAVIGGMNRHLGDTVASMSQTMSAARRAAKALDALRERADRAEALLREHGIEPATGDQGRPGPRVGDKIVSWPEGSRPLPEGAVVIDDDGHAWQHFDMHDGEEGDWHLAGTSWIASLHKIATVYGPATIVHLPDEATADD